MQHFENLNDVYTFLKEEVPNLKVSRGNNTWISEDVQHSEDYEVIQVFNPNDKLGRPFAEFWKGYYEFAPSDYTGFCGAAFGAGKRYFSCLGNLDFAMEAVLEENSSAN